MKIKVAVLTIIFGVLFVNAQEYERVVGAWNAVFLNTKINDKLHITSEFHHRTVNGYNTLDQHIFRPSINYKAPSGLQWTVGYSYLQNYNRDRYAKPRFLREQNLWEQLIYTYKGSKGGGFGNRLRLEHRFIEQASGPNPYAFSSRIRYRFTYAYPLFQEKWKGNVKAVFYDEVFLILDPGGTPFKFNQNWTFFGFNFKLSEKATLVTGYQKNTFSLGNDRYLINRFLNTTLKYSFK